METEGANNPLRIFEMYGRSVRTLPYNRSELVDKLTRLHSKMADEWKAGELDRRKETLVLLDAQIAKLKEYRKKIVSKAPINFRAYVSFYDGRSPQEIKWPQDPPREFYAVKWGLQQLQMSTGKTVRLRDDDEIVRLLIARGDSNATS